MKVLSFNGQTQAKEDFSHWVCLASSILFTAVHNGAPAQIRLSELANQSSIKCVWSENKIKVVQPVQGGKKKEVSTSSEEFQCCVSQIKADARLESEARAA